MALYTQPVHVDASGGAQPASKGLCYCLIRAQTQQSVESQDTLYWALQEGNVIKGHGRPEATAFWIHSRLHDRRPNTGAVFHTHQPEITALACLDGNFE